SQRALIPKICARSSPPITARSLMSSGASTALLRNTWATGCWFISATRERMRTTPNERSGRVSALSMPSVASMSNPPSSRRGSALTGLVGRDEEIDLLLRRWTRAKTGDGQVVLISGEAGIGKSRITAALAERLHAEPHLRLRYFCSPYHQDSALFPFIDQLGRAAGLAHDDMPAARLEKLEALLARAGPLDEDVAFLADLLSLPATERHPLPNLSPQRQKERLLEALIRQLEGLAC